MAQRKGLGKGLDALIPGGKSTGSASGFVSSGGAGVQRWLKTVKYLREYGWEPVVYTPENPEAPAIDNSLLKDIPEGIKVLKQPIWEPYSFYKKFLGLKKDEKINAGFLTEKKKPGLAEKIAVWIRGNFFIPDARKYWVKPSVEFLSNYLRSNPVDAVVSTGPPHSMHLIALALKQKTGIKWLADFRDPWTNIDFYNKLMLTKSADRKHRELEMQVLKSADILVTVSSNWAKDFKQLCNREVEIITNGFDENDFDIVDVKADKTFSIAHIGAMNKDRNPVAFWQALSELVNEDEAFRNELKIKLIGKNDVAVTESIEQNGLQQFTELIPYLPHNEIAKQICSSQVLLLPLNNTPNVMGIIPGKLFEYLAAKRPVFVIGNPAGDSARIVNEAGAGVVCDFGEKEKMKTELKNYFQKFLNGTLTVDSSGIQKFSRKKLAGDFAALLDSMNRG